MVFFFARSTEPLGVGSPIQSSVRALTMVAIAAAVRGTRFHIHQSEFGAMDVEFPPLDARTTYTLARVLNVKRSMYRSYMRVYRPVFLILVFAQEPCFPPPPLLSSDL